MIPLVAITGRSGSGKSEVGRLYASLGYPVCDADEVARQVVQPPSLCLARLAQRFGADVLDEEGRLRRRLLAQRAFADAAGAAALTAITHPEIIRRILAARSRAENEGKAVLFVDGAVIVGHALQKECDRIVLVYTDGETALRRVCARDGLSPAEARRRLAAQAPLKTLREAADYKIENSHDPAALRREALRVLGLLCEDLHIEKTI